MAKTKKMKKAGIIFTALVSSVICFLATFLILINMLPVALPLDTSEYEGWVELEDVRYSIGDTVQKLMDNGWEPCYPMKMPEPLGMGTGEAELDYLQKPGEKRYTYRYFSNGSARLLAGVKPNYLQEPTQMQNCPVAYFKVWDGAWRLGSDLASGDPVERMEEIYGQDKGVALKYILPSQYYPDKGDCYQVYFGRGMLPNIQTPGSEKNARPGSILRFYHEKQQEGEVLSDAEFYFNLPAYYMKQK